MCVCASWVQGPVTRSTKASIALQAARGMEYLHSQGVVHFDLKGENLLCDLRDLSRPVVKVSHVETHGHRYTHAQRRA